MPSINSVTGFAALAFALIVDRPLRSARLGIGTSALGEVRENVSAAAAG